MKRPLRDSHIPCSWCGTTGAYGDDGRHHPQRRVELVHAHTGEHRHWWLCWTCLHGPTRTIWRAWRNPDGTIARPPRQLRTNDPIAVREDVPFGIRELRRKRRLRQSFERRRAESLRRTNGIVTEIELNLARPLATIDVDRIAQFERKRAMPQEV